jgi:hypothetical protein
MRLELPNPYLGPPTPETSIVYYPGPGTSTNSFLSPPIALFSVPKPGPLLLFGSKFEDPPAMLY